MPDCEHGVVHLHVMSTVNVCHPLTKSKVTHELGGYLVALLEELLLQMAILDSHTKLDIPGCNSDLDKYNVKTGPSSPIKSRNLQEAMYCCRNA